MGMLDPYTPNFNPKPSSLAGICPGQGKTSLRVLLKMAKLDPQQPNPDPGPTIVCHEVASLQLTLTS